MEIVINISKDDFEKIKNISFVEDTERMFHQSPEDRKGTMMLFRVMDAIKNGKPLPKGYGKLIDENELKKEAIRCEWSRSMYSMLEHTLSYMKPIIEAEGSDSE